jgi:DNA primase catalytic subunit
LFPERVGKKYKANYAVPINGEYVIDIDSYLLRRWHKHTMSKSWNVCKECLKNSKYLAINVCQQLEQYYSDLSIVFSGRSGFHVHVHDFKVRDWTNYNEKNPIKDLK